MKIKFRVKESKISAQELFEALKLCLKEYWEGIEDMPFGAEYIENENFAKLRHSTGNTWYIELRDNVVYLGYQGSRLGFYSRTPWINTVEFEFYDDALRLFVEEKILQQVLGELSGELYHYRIWKETGLFLYVAYFEVHEYYTTTPPEWGLKYYELVVPVIETLWKDPQYAVVVDPYHGGYPLGVSIRKVVPYKNVYR